MPAGTLALLVGAGGAGLALALDAFCSRPCRRQRLDVAGGWLFALASVGWPVAAGEPLAACVLAPTFLLTGVLLVAVVMRFMRLRW